MAKPYSLEATVKGANILSSPFKLTISQPEQAETGEYVCRVDCPFLRFRQTRICGATSDQAMALALWLIDNQLSHRQCTLVDACDRLIALPINRSAGIPGEIGINRISE
ncbi:MAG: hypothetical protein HYW28_04890 [Rhodospirillales bacterium]|nr:hypothetical protein [Rhodospirillales bacterium]